MAMYVTDPATIDRIKDQRSASGSDRHDEVWDGVDVVSPLANNEHQNIVSRFTAIFLAVLDPDRLGLAFAGVNVSDREEDWIKNYREPDVAVFLEGTTARDMGTHWLGGPDLAIEILSLGDPAREKLEFYAKVHVRELLVVDRDPWRIELYRLARRRLALVDISTPEEGESIASKVLPLTFRLVSDRPRPTIEVVHSDGRRWEI